MLHRFKDYIGQSIPRKLVVCVIGCGLVFAFLAVGVRLVLHYNAGIDKLLHDVDQLTRPLIPALEQSVRQVDAPLLPALLANISSSENIDALKVSWVDIYGNRQQRFYPSHITSIKSDYHYASDSTFANDDLRLDIQLNTQSVIQSVTKVALSNLILVLLQALAVSYLVIYFVERLLARHLRNIARYANNLQFDTLDKPFELNGKVNQSDELSQVCDAINKMRLQLLEDINERHIIELALSAEKEDKLRTKRQQLAAESSNKAKSQFIATMSHEIRTPMNGIIGTIDLLQDTPLNESQKRYIDIIRRSGNSLISVINDILDYSKIEADNMTIESVSFNLEHLVDDCIQLFSATTTQNNIELLSAITPTTPRIVVGDPARLRQIILNLIGNAFKFTNKGYIYLHASVVSGEHTEHPILHFSVTDTGIGMKEDTQKYLFTPFNQADSSTTRRFGGTGLGLAICKKLVNLMDGEIGVDSDYGKGTTFWFTVKVKQHLAETKGVKTPLAGKKILVVNQDKMFSDILVQYCQTWEMGCKVTTNQAEAEHAFLQQSKSKRYSAVLINQKIGSRAGTELAEKWHKDGTVKNVPIILIGEESTSPSQNKSDIRHVINRPITSRKLKHALLDTLLEHAEQSSRSSPPIALPQLKALVAEDNPVNRLVIEGLLKKLNVTSDFVENGRLALEAATESKKQYDFILMDCEMPEMDGYESSEKIRAWEISNRRSPINIIALTAHVESEHKKRAYNSGMDYFLSKPVTIDDMCAALNAVGIYDVSATTQMS